MDYVIVVGRTEGLITFQYEVKEYLQKGYEIVGGLTIEPETVDNYGKIYQALIKRDN